jgi:hypothetical protein
VVGAEPWDEQTDAELQLDDRASVQVGADGGGAYYVLCVWTSPRTLHSGPMREDPAEVAADARAWLERGVLPAGPE